MSDHEFLRAYFARYRQALFADKALDQIADMAAAVRRVRDSHAKLIVVGNGGSASIADHAAVDFTKQGGVRTMSFASDAIVTALANDYGYDRWVAEALAMYADSEDLVVLISSSGRSPNIVQAAEYCEAEGLGLVTFSGFARDNPLRAHGEPAFWVDSRAYNVIENTHQIWLLAVCDTVIGQAEYSVS